jgi:hypothetical protein
MIAVSEHAMWASSQSVDHVVRFQWWDLLIEVNKEAWREQATDCQFASRMDHVMKPLLFTSGHGGDVTLTALGVLTMLNAALISRTHP